MEITCSSMSVLLNRRRGWGWFVPFFSHGLQGEGSPTVKKFKTFVPGDELFSVVLYRLFSVTLLATSSFIIIRYAAGITHQTQVPFQVQSPKHIDLPSKPLRLQPHLLEKKISGVIIQEALLNLTEVILICICSQVKAFPQLKYKLLWF